MCIRRQIIFELLNLGSNDHLVLIYLTSINYIKLFKLIYLSISTSSYVFIRFSSSTSLYLISTILAPSTGPAGFLTSTFGLLAKTVELLRLGALVYTMGFDILRSGSALRSRLSLLFGSLWACYLWTCLCLGPSLPLVAPCLPACPFGFKYRPIMINY